ncbi:hypothetical protein EVAR_53322_1 [Eumeta japonica]|uniref:Uncharacterized protein n=1 Tax=Eumeta variegata TaxID=151549 RepID=A0A4C1X5W8_EUMVA|nr:hypothetical protein EVAR_53322_1 [Eumeta japonica]
MTFAAIEHPQPQLSASWERITYLIEGNRADEGWRRESRPPKLSFTGRKATAEAAPSCLHSARVWLFPGRAGPFMYCNTKPHPRLSVSNRQRLIVSDAQLDASARDTGTECRKKRTVPFKMGRIVTLSLPVLLRNRPLHTLSESVCTPLVGRVLKDSSTIYQLMIYHQQGITRFKSPAAHYSDSLGDASV